MLIEVITFKLPDGMTREQLLSNYRDTTVKWSNVTELASKSYLYDEDARLGGGVYQWHDEEAADRWHGDDWRESVKELYGDYPEVRRFDVPIVVDNGREEVIEG